jgi:hypothetical protein
MASGQDTKATPAPWIDVDPEGGGCEAKGVPPVAKRPSDRRAVGPASYVPVFGAGAGKGLDDSQRRKLFYCKKLRNVLLNMRKA